ncbi:MAG TPA: DUF1385 domain-containing protein [Coriobacteriia bacterium]
MSDPAVSPEAPVAAAPVKATHIGGQALIEGVMMRGKLNWAVAVRTPDGSIHVEEHDLPGGTKGGWKKWPVFRGVWAMYETLALALKAFNISAQYADMSGGGEGMVPVEEAEDARLSKTEIGWTMVFGVALAVGLFIVLPALATNWIVGPSTARPVIWNVVDGALRLVVFFVYIWAVGLMPDIRRVFAYHGAEHKSIHAFEHGLPLEPALIQRYETLHVRCGTSFLMMVMVIAIVVFSLVPVATILSAWGITSGPLVTLAKIAIRILLLPVVAGLAYEVTVKWAGSRPENPFVKVLLWPGMQMQRLTTREPDDGMIEVAVAALTAVADREAAAADPAGSLAPEPSAEPALD